MIIGVAGKARSGKDLLYSFAQKDGWQKTSFAEALKLKVKHEFGLTEDHVNGWLKETPSEELDGHTPRELMIDFGNLYRKFKPDYWIDGVMAHIKTHPDYNYMITDVRFFNEALAIRNHGGILIRLERHPSRDNMVSEQTRESISETALDKFNKFDFVLEAIDNETPEQLAAFWNVVSNLITRKV